MDEMRLPASAHTSRPWRIHELTRDFRLEDVWALPTPGGPGDFPKLVGVLASFAPERRSSLAGGAPLGGRRGRPLPRSVGVVWASFAPECSSSRAVRALFALRWKLGDL